MQNHPRPRTLETPTGARFLSAHDFGAVGNGVADDTAALQAAIDAAGVSGRILIIPTGIYRITATLRVPHGNLSILGEAMGAMFQVPPPVRGTVLTWAGSVGGTMLDVGPLTPGPPYDVSGVRLENMTLDGVSSAAVGLLVSSVLNAVFRNLVVLRVTGVAVQTSVRFPIATGFSVVDHLEFSNLFVIVTGAAHGILIEGWPTLGGYGSAFVQVLNASVVHEHGTAYHIAYGDDNYFINCSASRITGGTGHAIFLAGSNDGSFRAARSNIFLGFNGQGDIRAQGLAGWSDPSVGNFILLTSMDTPPVITIDAGASLYYLDTGGYTVGSNARMRLPGLETAELNPVLPAARTAIKIVGNSNNGNPFISVVGGTVTTLPTMAVSLQLASYALGALPALAVGNDGALAYCTTLAGGREPVFWDGAGLAWKRCSDKSVVS